MAIAYCGFICDNMVPISIRDGTCAELSDNASLKYLNAQTTLPELKYNVPI